MSFYVFDQCRRQTFGLNEKRLWHCVNDIIAKHLQTSDMNLRARSPHNAIATNVVVNGKLLLLSPVRVTVRRWKINSKLHCSDSGLGIKREQIDSKLQSWMAEAKAQYYVSVCARFHWFVGFFFVTCGRHLRLIIHLALRMELRPMAVCGLRFFLNETEFEDLRARVCAQIAWSWSTVDPLLISTEVITWILSQRTTQNRRRIRCANVQIRSA